MKPTTHHRKPGTALVWPVTEDTLEDLRDALLEHPQFKGKFHVSINTSFNRRKLSLHLAQGRPLFMMSSGYLVLEDGKLWKWPAALFEHVFDLKPQTPPTRRASGRDRP